MIKYICQEEVLFQLGINYHQWKKLGIKPDKIIPHPKYPVGKVYLYDEDRIDKLSYSDDITSLKNRKKIQPYKPHEWTPEEVEEECILKELGSRIETAERNI